MPRLKSVKSLTEICMDFILKNKDFFYKRYTPREPKDGVDALDSVDPAINSFDHLRKLLHIIKTDKKNLIVMTTLTKLFLNSATELLEELIRRLRDRVKEARVLK